MDHVGPNHLLRIEIEEELKTIDDDLLDAHLLRVEDAPKELEEIKLFYMMGSP
jgi:hypothetical protein